MEGEMTVEETGTEGAVREGVAKAGGGLEEGGG